MVAAVSTFGTLIANYQPLRGGPIQWPPPSGIGAEAVAEHWLGPNGFQMLPPGAERLRIPAPQGLTFRYRYSFYNRGSVPVTVTSIGYPPAGQRSSGITRTVTAINVANTRWHSFLPFTLDGRQMVSVEVEVHVTACLDADAAIEWNGDRMTYTVFGFHRTDVVTTNVQVQLAGVPRPVETLG